MSIAVLLKLFNRQIFLKIMNSNSVKKIFVLSIFIIVVLTTLVSAANPIVSVRVISANPSTRTYTFTCLENPESGYVRDWYIHPDNDSAVEESFLDRTANSTITYTFPQKNFYHIGCIIADPVNTSLIYRGDTHIDLREKLEFPAIIPISVDNMKITVNCSYPFNHTTQWFISTYAFSGGSEPTMRIALNTTNETISYSPPMAGLFDPRCDVQDINTGVTKTADLSIDFFENKSPYIPDQFGIDLNNNFANFDYNTWISRFSFENNAIINNTNQTQGNMTAIGYQVLFNNSSGNIGAKDRDRVANNLRIRIFLDLVP